ncbi:hypothetical protein TNCT_663331, partial [Trichonephila clavata]
MTSFPEPGSLVGDPSDQCVDMEDFTASTLTEEQRCAKLSGLETQIQIFDARKDCVLKMIEIDRNNKHPLPETMPKLESELKFINGKINFLEGKLNDSLPCPVALCNHNFKFKTTKRHAEPILRPAKLTIKNKNKNNNNSINDFIAAKKPVKPSQEDKQNLIATANKFAVLDTEKTDAEDVTPAQPKIKLITMKQDYNLILQQIYKTHPTATNTHINGFIKIQPQTPDHHREITEFLTAKKVEYFVTDPLANRPLKYGTASASTIDYALVKNLNWPCTIESIPELSSDHNPINLHFPRTTKFQLPPPKLTTTWSKFRSILSNQNNFYLPDANSTDEVDTQVNNLTNEILSAHASASKLVIHSEQPFVQ